MKYLLLSLFVAGTLHAQSFRVLERQDSSTRTMYREVELKDLTSPDSFEGKYFRVVKGKGGEAISFHDEDKEMVLKAANTYHHLTKAREFWANKIGTQRVNEIPKLTVRVDITNLFDDQGHFAH